jgi:hypothetical protein
MLSFFNGRCATALFVLNFLCASSYRHGASPLSGSDLHEGPFPFGARAAYAAAHDRDGDRISGHPVTTLKANQVRLSDVFFAVHVALAAGASLKDHTLWTSCGCFGAVRRA